MINTNTKKVFSGVAIMVTGALIMLLGNSTALFTSTSEQGVEGSTTSLVIESVSELSLTNKDLFTPGDYDVNKDSDALPGSSHDLGFSIENKGDTYAITRNLVILSVDNNLDASLFGLVKAGSNGVSEGNLDFDHKVEYSSDYVEGVGGNFFENKEDVSGTIKAVRYTLPGEILNGEKETTDTGVDVANYLYGVSLSKDADNDYSNINLNVNVIVQAIQGKNVSSSFLDHTNNEWKTVFTDGI